MKHRLLMVLAALLLTATATKAQSGDQDSQPPQIELTAQERQLVTAGNDFAFRLLRQSRKADESMVLSPLSVTYALGMLVNGATGPTRDEICQVLGTPDAYVLNGFCRKLLTATPTLDPLTRVDLANAIYVNEGCELRPAFVEKARTYYDVEPQVRNFADGQTRDAINQWGADHTGQMVKEVLSKDDFDPTALSYLLNAIYFRGQWTSKFDASETRKYMFDDGRRTARLMHQEALFYYAETPLYESIVLPYGNRACQMTVFLPKRGYTLDELIAQLDGSSWQQASYDICDVDLLLPRMETQTDVRLEDILRQMGMADAFPGGEGFDEFCQEPVWIDLVKQSARLKLDEEGTEAAAVTAVGIRNTVAPDYRQFWADRPFLYVISEQSTGVILFMGQYVGEEITNVRHDIALTDDERQMVAANNDFAMRLFRQAHGDQSSVMSPLSITYALGMMNNGAAGQTQREICDVLGFDDADAVNRFCRKMLTEAPALDEETSAEIANTIFVNSGTGYELQPAFVEKADTYYDAQPQARDFSDGETMDVINQWADDHTHGMIPTILNEDTFDPLASSYLLNAIYFRGTWTVPFDPNETRQRPFGGGEAVPMMHQETEMRYAEGDLYQAVCLPYGNGAYEMTVVLPREDKTVDDVLQQMDGTNWQMRYNDYYIVDLMLPRFETDTYLSLPEVMARLGMPAAFGPEAEFPYVGNRDVFISNMAQKAKIKLNEEGTEAAAVTIIETSETSIPMKAELHADRPFVYIISERSTGVIFFIGQYTGSVVLKSPTAVGSATVSHRPAADSCHDLSGRRVAAPSTLKKGIYIVNGRKVVVG